jgi:NADPH:quinone reductase-like Zn-dependent oxidoreductase
VLEPGGRLLLVVTSLAQMVGAHLWSSRAGRKVLSGINSVRSADLLSLRALAESGAFKPVIDRTYEFARIVDAYGYVDTGRKKGNVVIILK